MKPDLQSRATGRYFRYAEYGLLVIIIAIIVLFLLDQIGGIHKKAERMAVLGEINTMRGEVIVRQAFDVSNSYSEKKKFRNPVRIMQKEPDSYLGEISHPEKVKIPEGSWYYDTKKGYLVYKARYEHKFPFQDRAVKEIRLALLPPKQAESNSTGKILSCGPKLCLTVANIQ
ncbi:MAG: hypothetical protein ACOCZ2_00970 [Thermodesulfobacteriota bacterium]